MQIFELHFNPKIKEDRFFDSFIYEPASFYEKKLGNLYMVGELRNALPQNSNFLENIARTIKQKYYAFSNKSPEKALSEDLKKINDFLAEEVKKDNVSWLENLNFAVISLKDFNLNFTKTGDIKILLLRDGQIMDIGKNLEMEEMEPYPLKIFFNIVSGKLMENDRILVLTKDIYDFFIKQKLISKIARAQKIDKKTLKEIIPVELFTKNEGAKISGVCFLAVLKKEDGEKGLKEIISQRYEDFSYSQIFIPLSNFLQKIKKAAALKLKKWLKVSLRAPFLDKVLRKIRIFFKKPSPKEPKKKIKLNIFGNFSIKFSANNLGLKKQLGLIAILFFILFCGFIVFKSSERKRETINQNYLTEIKNKINQAENFLFQENEKKADSLLKETWLEIDSLKDPKEPLKSELLSLKTSVEEKLAKINKLEKIDEPEVLLELNFKETGFTPHKILFIGSDLYFFNPESENYLYRFNVKEKKGIALKANHGLEMGDDSFETLLFFSKPNILIAFENGNWEEINLGPTKSNFDFKLFAVYSSNLYFWNKQNNEIVKYPYRSGLKWGDSQIWSKDKITTEPVDMAVDEFLWILNTDNSISRYYRGSFKESVDLGIFPFPKDIATIKTKANIPYVYLLEPKQKRVIVIDKNLTVVKQFQSDKFDNLEDLTVSENGKTIYLLNGWKVYKLSVN